MSDKKSHYLTTDEQREYNRKRRKRIKDNPTLREKERLYHKEYREKRMERDPEWVKRRNKQVKKYYDEKRKDPEYIKASNKRKCELQRINIMNHKQQVLDALGGCCIVCGYDKYIKAIEFHEIEKLFKPSPATFLRTKGGTQKLLDNLDILVPLCSNCHKEYHGGLIELPLHDR